MKSPISLAVLLERFFTQRLMQQRQASPYTINSYRDTFCQFLKFSEQRLKQAPSRLSFHQIDAPLITAFLDHLEKQGGISSRSIAGYCMNCLAAVSVLEPTGKLRLNSRTN